MEIYVLIEDDQPIKASEDYNRLARWLKNYAESNFKDYEDEEGAELNLDGLEASITVDGETEWEITYIMVDLL